jgi:ATP-dependent DNA helicase PIF1
LIQEEALKILKNGHNVYLTGAAGSGKTYLLNAYIQFLKSRGISTGVTASTGIAATHMEGITIHSWAGIGILQNASNQQIEEIVGKKRIVRRMQKTQTLIIDEISMLDGDRLDLLEKVTRLARGSWKPFGGLQVVLCGDFFQLPPVSRSDEPPTKPIYDSAAWRSLDLRVCYLHEQYRQGDQELLGILNAIRNAALNDTVVDRLRQSRDTQFPSDPINRFVRLYSHNPAVDSENERELANLPGEQHEYQMEIRGVPVIADALKKGCLAPEKLLLKKDAAVMFVKNNFERGFVNGTLGTVSGFNEAGLPVITLPSGKNIIAEPTTWSVEENDKTLAQIEQIPLRLAWAITVHKSQGMTLDAAQVDLSRCFEKGMGYVALSRVRSLEGLRVMGFNNMALEVSRAALAFDQELKQRSEEALQELKTEITNHNLQITNANLEINNDRLVTINKKSVGKKWTPDEEAKLIIGFRDGQSTDVLAKMLGREKGGIRSRLRKLGLIK